MAKAILVCIEREVAPGEDRFTRCTARSGREAGLALGIDGPILWCSKEGAACDLWVTGDQRLVAVRATSIDPVRLERGRRGLDLPTGRAVVVLDQDVIVLGSQRFRVHVHGETETVHPPRPLRVARGTAVVAAMTLAVGCGDGERTSGLTGANGGSPSHTTSAQSTSSGETTGGSRAIDSSTTGGRTYGTGGTITKRSAVAKPHPSRIEVIDFPPFFD